MSNPPPQTAKCRRNSASSLCSPNDGAKVKRAAWFLKTWQLPGLYWHVVLKGHE